MRRPRPSAASFFIVLVVAGCAPAPGDRDRGPGPPPLTSGAPAADTAVPEAAPAAAPKETPPPAPVAAERAPAPPVAEPAPTPPPADPLRQMRDEQMQQEDRRLALERAKDRMDAAKADVETLEKRLLAVRNPYLPRPQLPPEEASAWERLDGAGRAKRVEEQLAAARTQLEAARKAFADLGGRLD